MPFRILVALLIVIAAPLLLLGWGSTSRLRADRAAAQRQIESVLRSRLEEIDGSLQLVFDELQRHLSEQLEDALDGSFSDTLTASPQLTRLERSEPMVRQLVLINSSGRMIYPPPPGAADPSRIDEYAAISVLAASRPRPNGEETSPELAAPPASGLPNGKTGSPRPPLAESLYHVWYRDEGTQLSLWWPSADGAAIGMMLERSRWMAELVARLPDTAIGNWGHPAESPARLASPKDARDWPPSDVTTLYDESNRLVYRWGGDVPITTDPAAEVALAAPLSAWRLRYYTQQPLVAAVPFLGTYAALGGLGVVLFALGAYVLTQLQRQIRLARNRVTFAGQVSHELRTPLTNILLYAELAQSDLKRLDDQTAAAIAPRLTVINSESRRLSRLVSGVLEVIREDTRARPLRLLPHHADTLIDDAVRQFAPSFATAGIEVHRDARADGWVRLDADCVEMIVVNLLSNVEKYAAAGGQVRIESRLDPGRLVIRVADDGPGIAPRHRAVIFKAFRRLDDSISAPSGTGIGLTIARRLARRHGGDVQLVAAPRGACFEVTLAVSAAEAADASAADHHCGEPTCNFES